MTELNAESTASVEAPEVDSEGAETQGAGSAPAGTEAAASGELPEGFESWTVKAQERYHELTRDKYGLKSERDIERHMRQHFERENADLRARLEPAKTETAAPSNDYPTLESVGHDYDEHAKAVAAWAERRATAATQAALKADRESTERQNVTKTWQKAQEEFIKSTPDYVTKVLNAPTLPISEEAQDRIKRLPDGPRIALALVENGEKALAIMHLPIDVQMLEIGRIAGRTELKPVAVAPPVSKAPPPVAKIEASASVGDPDPTKMTRLQYASWRKKHGG